MTSLLALEQSYVMVAVTLIELAAAVVVALHAGWAMVVILRGMRGGRMGGADVAFLARRIVTDGVLAALGFSVAATLLKTIALEDWAQIRMFAFVLVFRTMLKRVFQWEQQTAMRRRAMLEGRVA